MWALSFSVSVELSLEGYLVAKKFELLRHQLTLAEEDDDRRRAHCGVLAGKSEAARFSMDAESGDRVAPLIARVKEIPRGIDIEASRIIASGPCLPGKYQGAPVTKLKKRQCCRAAGWQHKRISRQARP